MNKSLSIASALAFCLLATSAQAQVVEEEEPHFDVLVGRSAADSSQTLIGGALLDDVNGNDLNLTERLFEADTAPSSSMTLGGFHVALEPGFFNAGSEVPGLLGAVNPAGLLPLLPGEEVIVTPVGDVLYWDGVGTTISDVDFVSTNAVALINAPVPDQGSATGSIDNHPAFAIDDPDNAALPVDGIYLANFTVSLSGDGTTPGTDPSEEFSILFVTNEAFEEAVELAEVALTVPEPATLALVAALGVVLPCRRRV